MANTLMTLGLLAAFAVLLFMLFRMARKMLEEVQKATEKVAAEDAAREAAGIDPELEKVEGDMSLHNKIIMLTLYGYALLIFPAWLTWNITLLEIAWFYFNLGPVFLLPIVAHLILDGVKIVYKDQVGAFYFLERALRNANSGFHFAPFMKMETRSADLYQIWAPGTAEKIAWIDEHDDLPRPDMVRPIYMNTRAPKKKEKKPLDVQMTVGLTYTVWLRIVDLLSFLRHTRTFEEAEGQVRSISQTVLSEAIAKRTVDGAIRAQALLSKRMDNEIRARTKGTGYQVTRADVTRINASKKLAEKMRDRATAQFSADEEAIRADGEARGRERLAHAKYREGMAQTQGPLDGRAEGYANIAEATGAEGTDVMVVQTLGEIMPSANATYVTPGFGELVGGVKDAIGKFVPAKKGRKA